MDNPLLPQSSRKTQDHTQRQTNLSVVHLTANSSDTAWQHSLVERGRASLSATVRLTSLHVAKEHLYEYTTPGLDSSIRSFPVELEALALAKDWTGHGDPLPHKV